ncbi:hypothetical protein ACSQ67_012009 [Phaseolus vulgaris]
MDFATMRAKLHEGMYTDLEQFKRDIFLICSNATSVHSERSKYHEVSRNSTEAQKRDLYWPPNNPLFSDVLDANKKANIQLNENTINYKESLLRFGKGLGPVVENVAAKKLASTTG